jgi:hypothetical protein
MEIAIFRFMKKVQILVMHSTIDSLFNKLYYVCEGSEPKKSTI